MGRQFVAIHTSLYVYTTISMVQQQAGLQQCLKPGSLSQLSVVTSLKSLPACHGCPAPSLVGTDLMCDQLSRSIRITQDPEP